MKIAMRLYLVLIAVANLLGLASMWLNIDTMMARYPRLSLALVLVLFTAGLASLAAVVLIWRWKPLGIYLITASYAAMFAGNLYYGAPLAHTLLGPAGLAILFGLAWALRQSFSDGEA